jgi:uncharacterized membrane protein (DUF485 family)
MQPIYQAVLKDPRFRVLEAKRRRLSWTLAAIVLANTAWYTLATAFYPDFGFARLWGEPIGPGYAVTWGIVIGALQTVLFIALVGYYIYRANGEFDALTDAIVADAERFVENNK